MNYMDHLYDRDGDLIVDDKWLFRALEALQQKRYGDVLHFLAYALPDDFKDLRDLELREAVK